MTATIQIAAGGPPTTGSIEAAAATLCTFSNLDNTGIGGWFWELLDKPAGSAATLSSTTNPTTTITPDIPGTYMVRLTTYADASRTMFNDSDVQGVGVRFTVSYLWRLMSAYETDQFSASAGWKAELNSILTQIRTGLIAAAGGITQLTGDVTAGPGTGAQAATNVQARGLRETSGPTTLVMGAVADGEYIRRSGSTAIGGTPPGLTVGPAQCLFVDPITGNDATGTRGNAARPYLTIGGAIADIAANDDCIVLAPGVHSVTATLAEPAFTRYSIVGYGRDITRVVFDSGGAADPCFSIGASVTDRFSLRGFTLACATSDIGLVADGSAGTGTFMASGLTLSDMRFMSLTSLPTYGFVLTAVNRLDINDVIVEGYVQFDTCWTQPTITILQSRVVNLIIGLSTYIKWDDDVANAFASPMVREPMRFRECDLAEVQLDGQPAVWPERCTYGGLTSFNPLGESVTGVAAQWYDFDCIVDAVGKSGLIDFTGAQAILDVALSPVFYFNKQIWKGVVQVAFERVAEVNGRTTVGIQSLSTPGSFSFISPGLGIDARLFGFDLAPSIAVVSTGTFTPGTWRPTFLFGPTVAGANLFNFPWGAAGSGPNSVQVTASPFVPGEVLTAGPAGAAQFAVDAAIGGSYFYAILGWSNGN